MKKISGFLFSLLIVNCYLLIVAASNAAYAASPLLYFDASELGVKEKQEFELVMKINTDGAAVSGADVVLDYNPQMIEVLKIENGNFFTLSGKHYELNNQKIYITGFFTEKNETKSGSGVFAKLYLKAIKNGATSLKFVCVDKSLSDTNVIDAKGNDLLSCGALNSLQINVAATSYEILKSSSGFGKILGTESGALTTPSPTLIPTVIPTAATTSGMMETGIFDSAAFVIMLGLIFIIIGGGLLIYCRAGFNFSYPHDDLDPRIAAFHSRLE